MITFFLVNPTRKKSAIAILVSLAGHKYRRSTGESVLVKSWNKTKKRVKLTAELVTASATNDVLDNLEEAAMRTVAHFKQLYHPPTSEEFFMQLDKEYYLDDATEKPEEKESSFSSYLENTYIPRYKKTRSDVTIKKYTTALNKIKEYEEKAIKRSLRFVDIDIDFYNNFQQWFYGKGFSDNYFGSIIKVIKQAYREARYVDKLHESEGIIHKDFITTSKDSEQVYLSEDELQKIHNLKITEDLVLKHFPDLSQFRVEQKIKSCLLVRDRFLIGCYTGLRVSDFGRLSEMNFGKYIHIKTAKSPTAVVIPIHPIVQEILDSGFDADIAVSDQKINERIKDVAQMAEISENTLLHKHVGGKVVQQVLPKYKLISTHTARRSFATNAYKAGVPTIAIMKITGHKKESTFLKYIKVSAEENAEMLESHPFFKIAEPNAEPNKPNKNESTM